jgi:hypothetical protein
MTPPHGHTHTHTHTRARAYSAVNVAFAALLLPAALVTALWTAVRCFQGIAARKRWTQRRRRLAGLYAAQVPGAVCVCVCAGLRVRRCVHRRVGAAPALL